MDYKYDRENLKGCKISVPILGDKNMILAVENTDLASGVSVDLHILACMVFHGCNDYNGSLFVTCTQVREKFNFVYNLVQVSLQVCRHHRYSISV